MTEELADKIIQSINCLHELVENYGNGIMEQQAVIMEQQAVIIKQNSVNQSTEMGCVNINATHVIASCNRRVYPRFSPVPLDLDDVFVNGEWKKLPEKSVVVYVSDDDISLGELKTKKARTSKKKVSEKSEVVYDDTDDDIPIGILLSTKWKEDIEAIKAKKAQTSKRVVKRTAKLAVYWDDLHRIGLPNTFNIAESGSLWGKICLAQHRKNCLKKYNS
jgi:hypothetical protein